jgi:hypothetical protein
VKDDQSQGLTNSKFQSDLILKLCWPKIVSILFSVVILGQIFTKWTYCKNHAMAEKYSYANTSIKWVRIKKNHIA